MAISIGAAANYATLAMLDLALHAGDNRPICSGDIASRNDIPGPYLTQLLRTLKTAGWVTAIRGSQGGYVLQVSPDDLTLLDIADAVGGGDPPRPAADEPSVTRRALSQCYDEAIEASRTRLAQTRLGDLVRQCQSCEEVMFYI